MGKTMMAETTTETTDTKRRRGFAGMTPEARSAIASKGGLAVHERGTAHHFTSAEARVAGRKGGLAVARDRRHMAEIGAKGGRARRESTRAEKAKEAAEKAE